MLFPELRPDESRDLLDREEVVDHPLVELDVEVLVAVGVAVEKLLGHVVDAAVGQPLRHEGVGHFAQFFGVGPLAQRVVDGARYAFVDDDAVLPLHEFDLVGFLVDEEVDEAALAALAVHQRDLLLEKAPVGEANRTQRTEIDLAFHSLKLYGPFPGISPRSCPDCLPAA